MGTRAERMAHVSESALRHIENHRDLIEALRLKSVAELRKVVTSVLRDPTRCTQTSTGAT